MAPIRIALVGAIGTILAVLAGRAFDDVVWPLLLPPPLIAVVGLLCWRLRLRLRAACLAATVIVTTVVAGVRAGADGSELASGLVAGPRRLLTTEWPSPSDPGAVMAVALLLAVVTAVAVEAAGRPHLLLTPLAVLAVGLAAVMALSAPVRPPRWTIVALAVAATLIVLARPGEEARARLRTLLGERSMPVALAAIAASGVVASSALAWSDRADPRRTEDADTTATLLDPIEEVVAVRAVDPPLDLFRVTDRSTLIGPSLPTRWRTSALDEYDGQRWVPTITLRPIGSRLGLPAPASPDQAPPIAFDVELLTDDIDTLPIPGRPLEVVTDSRAGVQTDLDRTVVRLIERPQQGSVVRVTAEVAPGIATAPTATVATRQVDEIAGGFVEAAREMAGEGTVLDRLRSIEATMRDGWELDSEASGGGQQLNLIERFVNESKRGNEEQFVTAFVLLARSLGVEARVATGFVVPPVELTSPLWLSSRHAAVWPEVRLVGVGWLAFDPVPAEETTDVEQEPPPPSAQSPAAAQPPIEPPADRARDEGEQVLERESDEGRWETVRTWLGRVGLVGGLATLPVVIAIGTILGLKWWRRRRRLRAVDPVRRITGAWANATDSLVDAGLTIAPSWTDDRIAEQAVAIVPTLPHEVRRLAATATAMTFGRTEHGWRLVDDAVASSFAVDGAIRSERTLWQRLRWRLSLRSLRRATRSPVMA